MLEKYGYRVHDWVMGTVRPLGLGFRLPGFRKG